MAFRLNNTSLPAAPSDYKLAPFIRTFLGNRRGMGSLLTVNYYAIYGGAVEPEILPTPEPIYQGTLVKIPLDGGIQVTSLSGFSLAANPLAIKPYQFWASDLHLYLYTLVDITESLTATTQVRSRISRRQNLVYEFVVNSSIDGVTQFIKSSDPMLDAGEFIQDSGTLAIASSTPTTVKNLQPVEENWIYTVTVPSGITITRIESLGLEFLPVSTRPNPGEFQQVGTTITICGSPQYRLDIGQELVIFGTQAIALDLATKLKIATFQLLTVFYLDKIEWRGLSFVSAADALNPQANEFFWSDGYATVFF